MLKCTNCGTIRKNPLTWEDAWCYVCGGTKYTTIKMVSSKHKYKLGFKFNIVALTILNKFENIPDLEV